MKALNNRYKHYFTNKYFVLSVVLSIIFLIIALVINFYAGTYATESASSPVKDLILSNIPVFDVDIIFIYGPLVLWLFVATLSLYDPKKIPFIFKSIALFIVIRSVFITLTHIGPFPDQIALDISHNGWINHIFWNNKLLRVIFIVTAVFFGIIVLMGHLHYSIDVLSAFFITYTIYHISEVIFKKDKVYFDEVTQF